MAVFFGFGGAKAKREAFLLALHREGIQAEAGADYRAWLGRLLTTLSAEYPEADQYALSWFLAPGERYKKVEGPHGAALASLLGEWIVARPAPGALDGVLLGLESRLDSGIWAEAVIWIAAAAKLERAQTGHLPRSAALLHQALRIAKTWPQRNDKIHILRGMVRAVLEEGALAELDRSLLADILLMVPWDLDRVQPTEALTQVVHQFLQQAAAGTADARTLEALCRYTNYTGADHFLTAVRHLERHPKGKVPLAAGFQWEPDKNPLVWAVWVLVNIAPPEKESLDLNGFSPATLLTAALLAPAWAPLLESALSWPGLADLIRWLHTYGDTGHWREHRRDGAKADEEETGGVDREGALQAVALMGEERLARLMAHPVAKSRYRDGLYYLQACRGENGADVEAGFVKRDKKAVRALGLLPDEGDILQRYLALLRFAKEARQFGAQRQASEWQAVQDGLDNLAGTAGFSERSQLEWAMEAQLAQEMDPSAQRWQIEDYTVWIEPDAKATLAVERNGKRVKSVPPAVRQAPEYEAIKDCREQLQAQWERVRQRLELAMATGETMDREAFTPALTTPAGKAMLPFLVLRCWGPAPVVQLGADGSFERYQVAHPLTLGAEWLSRPIEQPFPQLTRETYTATPAELEQARVRRFEGRQVRLGPLKEKLKRFGWRGGYEGDLERKLPGGARAWLWFKNGAAYFSATDVLTVGELQIHGKVDEIRFSELLREVDLATRAAAVDKTAT